jgi:membrane protease YdiL (CAAX protease family)
MASRTERLAAPTIVGLVLSIGVVDVVANVLVPEDAKLPLKLVIAVGYLAWARRSARLSWPELGLGRADVGAGLRWGAAAAVVIGAVLALAAVSNPSQFEHSSVVHDSTAARFLEPLVFIPLGTVVFEEVIFRGVLLGALLRWSTRRTAVVTSAIVFGLWHLPPAIRDAKGDGLGGGLGVVVGTIAFTTFAGVLFAWLRLRSGSLLAPVCAHIASNSFAYVAAVIALQ